MCRSSCSLLTWASWLADTLLAFVAPVMPTATFSQRVAAGSTGDFEEADEVFRCVLVLKAWECSVTCYWLRADVSESVCQRCLGMIFQQCSASPQAARQCAAFKASHCTLPAAAHVCSRCHHAAAVRDQTFGVHWGARLVYFCSCCRKIRGALVRTGSDESCTLALVAWCAFCDFTLHQVPQTLLDFGARLDHCMCWRLSWRRS